MQITPVKNGVNGSISRYVGRTILSVVTRDAILYEKTIVDPVNKSKLYMKVYNFAKKVNEQMLNMIRSPRLNGYHRAKLADTDSKSATYGKKIVYWVKNKDDGYEKSSSTLRWDNKTSLYTSYDSVSKEAVSKGLEYIDKNGDLVEITKGFEIVYDKLQRKNISAYRKHIFRHSYDEIILSRLH